MGSQFDDVISGLGKPPFCFNYEQYDLFHRYIEVIEELARIFSDLQEELRQLEHQEQSTRDLVVQARLAERKAELVRQAVCDARVPTELRAELKHALAKAGVPMSYIRGFPRIYQMRDSHELLANLKRLAE